MKSGNSELFWSVFSLIGTEYALRIQSISGKIRTRITPNTDTFYAVIFLIQCDVSTDNQCDISTDSFQSTNIAFVYDTVMLYAKALNEMFKNDTNASLNDTKLLMEYAIKMGGFEGKYGV